MTRIGSVSVPGLLFEAHRTKSGDVIDRNDQPSHSRFRHREIQCGQKRVGAAQFRCHRNRLRSDWPWQFLFSPQGLKLNAFDDRGGLIRDYAGHICVQNYGNIVGSSKFIAILLAKIRSGTPLRTFHT